MNFSKKNKYFFHLSILVGFITLIIAAYNGEDLIGGAKYDYSFHKKYIVAFYENFYHAFSQFGNNYEVRNSPVFFMYSSFFLKAGLKIEYLKYFNLIIIIPLIIFFIKCLDVKFKNITFETKAYLTSIIFISPTIRSLSAWPYPLTWAICFFLISIYFFIKFQESKVKKNKIKYSILNIIFLALSAYFTPNFGVFSIFYLFYFLRYFKFSKESFFLILINLIISIPAIYFLIIKDFYLFKHEASHVITNYSLYDTLNISNKIIIISSMIFLFFIPFTNINKNLNKKIFQNSWLILIFIFINLFFFDFQKGLGGGLFFHLSNILFNGPVLLFFIFAASLFIFREYRLFNNYNIFLFIILIFYNIQSTIYYKYYDPILYFMILFLFKFQPNFNLEKISKKCFLFYLFFLSINYGKKFIIY